mgnify:FL=1
MMLLQKGQRMMIHMSKNVWEVLWDYDPNGLVALDENMQIKLVNPAFVKLFHLNDVDVIGRHILEFFEDADDFYSILQGKSESIRKVHEYRNYGMILSEVTFRIENEGLLVKIFHDISEQERKEKEMKNLKIEIIEKVQNIVDKQMKVGQEIASILGETTAETKATLVKLLEILKKEG